MALFHQYDVLTNTRGDSLAGYRVAVRQGQAVVPIYADAAQTPIVAVSGIANVAVSDSAGNYSFFVAYGTYDLQISSPDGALLKTIAQVPMLVGDVGPQGDKGDPGGNVMAVGPFTTLPSLNIPLGTDLIQTSGATRGDLIADTSLTDADVAAHPLAITKTANGRFFRRDTRRKVTPFDFGAKGDGSTDDLAAFNAALAYLRRQGTDGGFYRGADGLLIPSANFFLNGTWEVKGLTTIIEGEGTGQAGGNATVLRFPANTCGIRIHRYNTVADGIESTPTQGSDGTIIRNLALVGAKSGGANVFQSGIWARCRVTIRDVAVDGFNGAGILIRATQGSPTPSFEGNANNWRIDTTRLIRNAAGGLVLQGADANAGVSHGVDASNNGGYGIDDQSFLGNRHAGFQMEANAAGPWRTTDPNAFCWMDGYTEPGQNDSIAAGNTLASGPQFVNVQGGTTLRGAGLDGGGLASSMGFYARRVVGAGPNALKSIWGSDPSNGEFAQMFTAGGAQFGFADGGNEEFILKAAAIFEALRVTGGFTGRTFGRPSNATTRGKLHLQSGAWFGAGDAARNITYVNAADAAGAASALAGVEVAKGDRFYFVSPVPGGKEGVVVTTSGVVGSTAVLNGFGAIDA